MADIAEGRAAFRDPSAQVNDTLTLICGFVDVERSNHAFPMLMDRINRVRLPSVLSYRSAVEVVASGHERGTTVQAPSRTTHGADHVDRRRAPDPGAVGAAAQEQPGAGVALPDRAGLRPGLVERGGRRAPGCACRHGRQVAPPVRRP